MRVYLLSARDAVEPVLDVAALRGGADSGPKPGSGPSLGGYERLRQPGRSYREAGAELYRQMAAVAGPAVGREPSIVLVRIGRRLAARCSGGGVGVGRQRIRVMHG